mmetsp:Transcript_44256/g.102224  ORF Transcript_44256/g.102224 Transcript_44256/m.102224 type:complete len:84 (-) Transcript_44256:103-354(-)
MRTFHSGTCTPESSQKKSDEHPRPPTMECTELYIKSLEIFLQEVKRKPSAFKAVIHQERDAMELRAAADVEDDEAHSDPVSFV